MQGVLKSDVCLNTRFYGNRFIPVWQLHVPTNP